MSRALLTGLLAAASMAAQTQKLVYSCTDEDIISAGLACSEEEPCPIYLELSSIESIGQKLFVIGNVHTSRATLVALLLSSADGGKTWIEPVERLSGATLDRVMFVDFENGWISGQFLHPVPRDPFILRSTDGGVSWRKSNIFSDSRAGTILEIAFASKNEGVLMIDRGQSTDGSRYEKYESMTGGASWMLREVADRPIPLKRLSSESTPPWRLRADAKTKSYVVERRDGAKWAAAASFLIDLDPCKPPVPATPEPLAEPEPAPSGTFVIGTPEKKKQP